MTEARVARAGMLPDPRRACSSARRRTQLWPLLHRAQAVRLLLVQPPVSASTAPSVSRPVLRRRRSSHRNVERARLRGRARAAAWRGWRRRRRRAVGWAAGAAMPVPRPGKTRAPPPIKSCRGATLVSVRLVLSQEGAIVCSRSARQSTCAEKLWSG